MKPLTRRALIKKLDRLFSEILRWERSENGLVKCFTCGKVMPIRKATVGHFIKRQFIGTRYNEINCQIQCRRCNYYLQGNDVVFERKLRRLYGKEVIAELELAKKQKIPTWKLRILQIDFERRLTYVKQLKGVQNERNRKKELRP